MSGRGRSRARVPYASLLIPTTYIRQYNHQLKNRLHAEYKQVVKNLWRMWDNADSDETRKGIEANVQLMDSVINELLIYGVNGKPK